MRPRPAPVGARHRGPADDRGSATVIAATAVGVLLLLLVLGLALAAAVLARHRAEHAADFAALAAASEAVRGRDVACARAGDVAAVNGARLESCSWSGWAVDVRVVVFCGCLPNVSGTVVGGARAGPVVTSITSDAAPATTRSDRPGTLRDERKVDTGERPPDRAGTAEPPSDRRVHPLTGAEPHARRGIGADGR